MPKFKMLVNLSKFIFSACFFFMHIFIMPVTYLHNIQKDILKALGGVDFTKYAHINHYSLCSLVENWLSSKCCKLVKNIFLDIRLLHANLQYACNIPA